VQGILLKGGVFCSLAVITQPLAPSGTQGNNRLRITYNAGDFMGLNIYPFVYEAGEREKERERERPPFLDAI